jgi:serine/threonine protein kinase
MKCQHCQAQNPPNSLFCGNCGGKLSLEGTDPSATETYYRPLTELAAGSTFAGRYQIIEELGRGGMGRVYKALDKEINEKVAIKILKPEISAEKGTIERFRNELRLARKIRHKNVCQMYDITTARNLYFITMEYVSGEDLKTTLNRVGRLSVGKTLLVARQICKGLSEAHGLGVIHRDLKPHNIMIDRAGDVRIMDFGVARSLKSEGLTESGVMIGTPDYMSPEQALGDPVDERSDIYSLGVILYELLVGEVPFKGDTAFSVALKHKTEPAPNPKELNDQLPDDVAALLLKCLEKEKKKRFQNTEELLQEIISTGQRQPTTEKVVPDRRQSTALPRKGFPRFVLPAALLLAAMLIVALVFWPDGGEVLIEIDTSPPDAEVFLNNRSLGSHPVKVRIKPGVYKIRVEKEGYQTREEEFTIDSDFNEEFTLEAAIAPPVQTGTLDIYSSPTRADVFIDDKFLGITPLRQDLPSGSYALRIKHAEYREQGETIDIVAGEAFRKEYKLIPIRIETPRPREKAAAVIPKSEPPPIPETYLLTVTSTPAEAELYLDGELAGQTPIVELEKRPGTYRIQIRMLGYRTATDTVDLKANEERAYNLVKLEKIILSIIVGPAADVYVDGDALGEIPPTRDWEVEEGRHTIEFKSDSLDKSFRTQIEVLSGQRWELRMNMRTGRLVLVNGESGERLERTLAPIK